MGSFKFPSSSPPHRRGLYSFCSVLFLAAVIWSSIKIAELHKFSQITVFRIKIKF